MTGERVFVRFRDGTEREGTVRHPWDAPLYGAAYIVDVAPFEYVIAPAVTVRRPSESGD